MTDPINHPPHYTSHPARCECGKGVECITVTEHMNFNLGNAVKYLWRAGQKGDALTDLKKAAWYVNREIERIQKQAKETPQPTETIWEGEAMSHTPGPWSPFLDIRECDRPGIDHSNGSLIMFGYHGEDCGIRGDTHEERVANACLIAAAPDLLEALKYISANLVLYHETSYEVEKRGYELMNSAIAKARIQS